MNIVKIKEIVAHFLKVNIEEINDDTPINKKNLGSSIFQHRLYAKLEEHGLLIDNSNQIKKFSDLFTENLNTKKQTKIINNNLINNYGPINIGIDIEHIDKFPKYENEENFYKSTFTDKEIKESNNKKDFYESMALKFALIEAMIKADNSLLNLNFKEIEILGNNQPLSNLQNFVLSASHSENIVIGVAIKIT